MRIKNRLIFFCQVVFLILFSSLSQANHSETAAIGSYSLVATSLGDKNYSQYLDSIAAPKLVVNRECTKNNSSCWSVIKDSQGKRLKRFNTSTKVSNLASGRYKDRAYLYYSETYTINEKQVINYFIIDNKGKTRQLEKSHRENLAMLVNYEGKLIVIDEKSNKIYAEDKLIQIANPPAEIKYAELGSNPDGKIAAIAVDEYGDVYVSDLDTWFETQVSLSRKGDRKGILSIYPADNKLHFAVYKYINSYNKGLIYGQTNLLSKESKSGWLFNSENENIGFDPSIYQLKDKEEVIVAAYNSSIKEKVHFKLPLSPENLTALSKGYVEHLQGFEEEKKLDLLVGVGAAVMDWKAKAEVEKDSTTYAKTKYDLSTSIYKSIWLQGRWNNKQLALSYAKNEAEKKGGNTKKASQLLNAVFDINGFFSPRSSLRLTMEQAKLGGIAKLSINEAANVNYLNSVDNREFETKLNRYSALVLRERGLYWGAMYESYSMPSLLGFSDSSGGINYIGYDKKLSIDKYGLMLGYDEMEYIRRYENNVSRFYYDGSIGISYVNINVSSELKNQLRQQGNKKLEYPFAFGIDGKLDVGYVYQRKVKQLKGAGYLLNAGYRIKGGYLSSLDSNESAKENKARLELSRFDIWHGVYANVSLVF